MQLYVHQILECINEIEQDMSAEEEEKMNNLKLRVASKAKILTNNYDASKSATELLWFREQFFRDTTDALSSFLTNIHIMNESDPPSPAFIDTFINSWLSFPSTSTV